MYTAITLMGSSRVLLAIEGEADRDPSDRRPPEGGPSCGRPCEGGPSCGRGVMSWRDSELPLPSPPWAVGGVTCNNTILGLKHR